MPSDYNQSSIDRHVFRHTHDGPETPRHRRKKKSNDRSRCEHSFEMTASRRYGPPDRQWGYDQYNCSKCGKKQTKWFDYK
jgi:hypothetical protein